MARKPRLVIVGNGMVGHRLVESLLARDATSTLEIVVFGDEPRPAYDRVHLSTLFSGASAADLALASASAYARAGVIAHVGESVVTIDRNARMVIGSSGRELGYDWLVLATGSRAFVPEIAGADGPGAIAYRTIEDAEAIAAYARSRGRGGVGAVIGGGLLGLEAAGALHSMGVKTHVIEFAPRLMAVQVDDGGGAILRRIIEDMGVVVHTGMCTTAISRRADGGAVTGLMFADGSALAVDMVVFSAGIRARDELARASGLEIGPRGGVVIDERCCTSDAEIYAIGECASWRGQTLGLVAPGYAMAEVVAAQLMGDTSQVFTGADMSTKLKLLGVDVASFGDAHGTSEGSLSYSLIDQVSSRYKKIVLSADKKQLIGGILVGDASEYDALTTIMRNGLALPQSPEALILPAGQGGRPALGGPETLPASAQICSCNNVGKGAICAAIRAGAHTAGDVKRQTRAGSGCGGCLPMVGKLVDHELTAMGVAVSRALCEHFAYTRQELYSMVRITGIRTFDELLARAGKGRGCAVCKPAVASILASCWNEHVLEPKHAGLQDSNDYFLANIQRDGTYSVVPRVPGGEITPDKLIAIGQLAKKYDLYTKITGGQRIDLFGAKAHELPAIWAELIAAGFESGHAYGKALRTVKSCVGSTWCRYGVQDSVGLSIRLEDRYKGLRAPHKLKMAVSGCTRECAEAQSKDVGVIATDKGYNLYVCGNGGMKPRHADLFATDLDEETLIRYIDRFLMLYIRTADRLQRTARWLEDLEGGLDYLRTVIIDDKLGIAAELEAEMAQLVATYQCEWRQVIENPGKLDRFKTFVNRAEQDDPSLLYVRERGQKRPAYEHERPGLMAVFGSPAKEAAQQ